VAIVPRDNAPRRAPADLKVIGVARITDALEAAALARA
jgi:hypothetical protein